MSTNSNSAWQHPFLLQRVFSYSSRSLQSLMRAGSVTSTFREAVEDFGSPIIQMLFENSELPIWKSLPQLFTMLCRTSKTNKQLWWLIEHILEAGCAVDRGALMQRLIFEPGPFGNFNAIETCVVNDNVEMLKVVLYFQQQSSEEEENNNNNVVKKLREHEAMKVHFENEEENKDDNTVASSSTSASSSSSHPPLLFLAVEKNATECLRFLIEKVKLPFKDAYYETASSSPRSLLHEGLMKDSKIEVFEILLENGIADLGQEAFLNTPWKFYDEAGRTLMMEEKSVAFIIKSHTALSFALIKNRLDFIELFAEKSKCDVSKLIFTTFDMKNVHVPAPAPPNNNVVPPVAGPPPPRPGGGGGFAFQPQFGQQQQPAAAPPAPVLIPLPYLRSQYPHLVLPHNLPASALHQNGKLLPPSQHSIYLRGVPSFTAIAWIPLLKGNFETYNKFIQLFPQHAKLNDCFPSAQRDPQIYTVAENCCKTTWGILLVNGISVHGGINNALPSQVQEMEVDNKNMELMKILFHFAVEARIVIEYTYLALLVQHKERKRKVDFVLDFYCGTNEQDQELYAARRQATLASPDSSITTLKRHYLTFALTTSYNDWSAELYHLLTRKYNVDWMETPKMTQFSDLLWALSTQTNPNYVFSIVRHQLELLLGIFFDGFRSEPFQKKLDQATGVMKRYQEKFPDEVKLLLFTLISNTEVMHLLFWSNDELLKFLFSSCISEVNNVLVNEEEKRLTINADVKTEDLRRKSETAPNVQDTASLVFGSKLTPKEEANNNNSNMMNVNNSGFGGFGGTWPHRIQSASAGVSSSFHFTNDIVSITPLHHALLRNNYSALHWLLNFEESTSLDTSIEIQFNEETLQSHSSDKKTPRVPIELLCYNWLLRRQAVYTQNESRNHLEQRYLQTGASGALPYNSNNTTTPSSVVDEEEKKLPKLDLSEMAAKMIQQDRRQDKTQKQQTCISAIEFLLFDVENAIKEGTLTKAPATPSPSGFGFFGGARAQPPVPPNGSAKSTLNDSILEDFDSMMKVLSSSVAVDDETILERIKTVRSKIEETITTKPKEDNTNWGQVKTNNNRNFNVPDRSFVKSAPFASYVSKNVPPPSSSAPAPPAANTTAAGGWGVARTKSSDESSTTTSAEQEKKTTESSSPLSNSGGWGSVFSKGKK